MQKGRSNKSDRRGERNTQARLTEVGVKEIRILLSKGYKQSQIAEQFNINNTTVSNIKTRHTWRHIQ